MPDHAKRYPALSGFLGEKIDAATGRTQWPEFLRLATSIKQGTVTASLTLRKLTSHPRQNGLALALREIGRIERTLFTLEWLTNPALRQCVTAGLNKGEAKNTLARVVCLHRFDEFRDRTYELQRLRTPPKPERTFYVSSNDPLLRRGGFLPLASPASTCQGTAPLSCRWLRP